MTPAHALRDVEGPAIERHQRQACRPGCSSPGKHPRTQNGLSDATTDVDQIRRWWGMWPAANIGAVVPDGFIVVDVDVADLATAFRSDELPRTATSRTGRGRHLIYRTATPIRPKVGVREHIDLRGPSSYIVVPPSLHSSGVRYEWVVPIEDGIADAPAWIAEAARLRRSADDRSGDSDSILEGERNVRLTSLAGTMRRRGMMASEIEVALLAINAGRCRPPLPEAEVRTIAVSIGSKPPGPSLSEAAADRVDHLSRQSLAAHHFSGPKGADIRFDHGRRIWLIWRDRDARHGAWVGRLPAAVARV